MEREEYLQVLLNKYLAGGQTKEELEELLRHFEVEENKGILQEMIAQEMAKANTSESDALIRAISENVEAKLFRQIRRKNRIRRLEPWHAIAAMLLIGLSFGGYFYLKQHKPADIQVAVKPADILPGGNRAILTLGDGTKVNLTAAKNGEIAKQSGARISKAADGQVAYTITGNPTSVSFNTIETPMGGEYQVMLPDGTKAWLNAASSLKYPTSFASLKNREVELTGEAYFEVAHNRAQTFLVKTAKQTVEVLGTHFNVMAYKDEVNTKTTLLEGSVKVSNGNSYKMLKPGQESLVKGDIKIREADVDAAVAWKNGRTYFKDADIPTIMRSLGRWYNIDIVYQGDIPDELFTGGISRKSNLSSLLKILESGGIKATIEGRKLIVKP